MPSIPGNPWVICDLTGVKVRMSQTRKTWDGYRVWSHVWYPKQPLLSVRGIPDNTAVADARPRPVDVFIEGAGGFLNEPFLSEIEGFIGEDVPGLLAPPVQWSDL
jgi:hypothetical protein